METFAYVDSGHEFPEEIIMAAGFSPLKILGDVHQGTAAADEYLFPFFLSADQSVSCARPGKLGKLDGYWICAWL